MKKHTLDAVHADLNHAIGAEQVRFDDMTRVLYSTDASNYQIMPHGVTFPRHADDVVAIHEIATKHKIPILPRGGGSSLAGQTVGAAIVMDTSRHMRRMRGIQAEERRVVVEPGLTLGILNKQLASMSLMFGPDPASAQRATVGGSIGNNASGAHSILYGMTADHICRLQVVLASGECVWLDESTPSLNKLRAKIAAIVRANTAEIKTRYPKTFRTVAGYALNKIDPNTVNLNWLLAGSEGTLGTIVAAELKLVPLVKATHRRLALVHFGSLIAALEATPQLLELNPSAIELLDRMVIERTREHTEYSQHLTFIEGNPSAVQVVEFYGENDVELTAYVDALKKMLTKMGHQGAITLATTPEEQARVWAVRKVGLGLLMSERREDKPIAFVEDTTIPVENLANYIRDIDAVISQEGTSYAIYGHASAGCLHVRPLVSLKTLKGREQYRRIAEAATDAAIKYQGTTTGEHGEGLARGEFSERLFGQQLTHAFREVKAAFDPANLMNPGKVVDAPPMDEVSILRYTPAYEIIPITPRFDWSGEGGFSGAIEMCNGAGVCRKEGTGTMCPSYMATLDEAHSTRGRANALRAAMSGKLPGGMASQALHDVLDLCLSCKACKSECPSSVDMAQLKAESTAAYHDIHGIPFKKRVFGNIHRLNKLGAFFPRLSNFMLTNPLGKLAMRVGGIPTKRPLPRFAPQRFSQLMPQPQQAQAILIVDTFTEFNHPQVGIAFLRIAEALGLRVEARRLAGQGCCGRPALSNGLLDLGKALAQKNVQMLATTSPELPLLFLEPSCLSAFLDDYPALVEDDLKEAASALTNRCMSAETWLDQHWEASRIVWKKEVPHILLHGHCHQKALWGTGSTKSLLQKIPHCDVQEIDSGCCGIAGSFGYEHYDLSLTIANQRLFPALRAHLDRMVVAPGTSCRSQIHDAGFTVQHPVEAIAYAMGLLDT